MIRILRSLWRANRRPLRIDAPHGSVMPRPWRYYARKWTPDAGRVMRRL